MAQDFLAQCSMMTLSKVSQVLCVLVGVRENSLKQD
jgi:hypothetical protein